MTSMLAIDFAAQRSRPLIRRRTQPNDIGRDGFRQRALRTGRAAFPQTTLWSLVSSSRLSRRLPGCAKREQAGLGERGIGPLSMILLVSAGAGTPVLFAQHGAQAPPDHPVKLFLPECARLKSVRPTGCRQPGFALGPRTRRATTPPPCAGAGCTGSSCLTGRLFAAGCSPPRLTATQLPSAPCGVTSHGLDFHLLTTHHHGHTVPARLGTEGVPRWPG